MTTEPKFAKKSVYCHTCVLCMDHWQWSKQLKTADPAVAACFWTRGSFATARHLALIYFCSRGVPVILGGIRWRFNKFFSLRLKHGQSDVKADKILAQVCLSTRELVSEMLCNIEHRAAQRWASLLHKCYPASPKVCLPSWAVEDGSGWPSHSFSLAGIRICSLKRTKWCLRVDLLTLKQTTCSTLASWFHAIGQLSILTLDPAQVSVLDLAPVPTFDRGCGRAGVRVTEFGGRLGVSGRGWSLGCRGLVAL